MQAQSARVVIVEELQRDQLTFARLVTGAAPRADLVRRPSRFIRRAPLVVGLLKALALEALVQTHAQRTACSAGQIRKLNQRQHRRAARRGYSPRQVLSLPKG